jgi:diguanylate cyclase (GGDEF)-like protein
MELDTRTLVVASLLVATVMGTFSLGFATMQGNTRVIADWGTAVLVLAAGLLGIALRGIVPDVVSVAVANTLIVAGLVLGIRSLRVFCGQRPLDTLGWGVTAGLLVTLLVFSEIWPRPDVRVALIFAAIVVVAMRAALLLRRNAPPECRMSCLFTESVFWAVAALTAVRAAVFAFEGPREVMLSNVLNSVTFLSYTAFILVTTLGVTWMEIQHLHSQLLRLATRDPLTEILNRRGFLDEVEREIARSRRAGQKFGLAVFDIDGFKQVNDTYGHPFGDLVLNTLVKTIVETLREYDMIGRYGGEEFIVLMPDTDREAAVAVAERARHAVEQRAIDANGTTLRITVSGGVAEFGRDGADWDALLIAADSALYDAKNGGRNRIATATVRKP